MSVPLSLHVQHVDAVSVARQAAERQDEDIRAGSGRRGLRRQMCRRLRDRSCGFGQQVFAGRQGRGTSERAGWLRFAAAVRKDFCRFRGRRSDGRRDGRRI